MQRKYLLIINLSGSYGGAEIRYLNLFKEISFNISIFLKYNCVFKNQNLLYKSHKNKNTKNTSV